MNTCPNCGYCPHCGRGGHNYYQTPQYYPYTYGPTVTYGPTNGAWGGVLTNANLPLPGHAQLQAKNLWGSSNGHQGEVNPETDAL